MKHLYLILITAGLVFTSCSKKTTDAVNKATNETNKTMDLTWRGKAPAPAPARPIQLGDYTSFDLENGLKVIVVENHKLPRVSYQLSLKNDPIVEGDQVGYVSFAGSLLNTGTTNRSKAEIDEAVDFIGASMSTSSRGVFASSLVKHSDKLLELMTDVLYNPTFPEAEFEKLKKQTLSDLASSKTDPGAIASNVASIVNYGKDHPYGEIETEETINNIDLEKCRDYYNTYFKPNNAFLVIVGDIDPMKGKETAEKYFGNWKQGDVPNPTYEDPEMVKGRKVAFANKDGAVQSVIRVTYPVELEPGSADAIKASVANNILGGGIFSGRLMQNLREDKAYTYGARSSLSSDELIGSFNASASVRNEVTDSSVTQFLYEMERMVNEPVSVDDLSLVKSSMAGSFARSLESPQTIARFALNTYRFNLPSDYYSTYLQKLEAVSIADVQMMSQKYIRPDNTNIVVVGSKDDVAERLIQFDSDGEIDYYDAYGNLLDMDAAVIPEGMDGATVVSTYLDAIGGKDKIMGIKTLTTITKMDLMGQPAMMEVGQENGEKMYMVMSMGGNVMQEQRYDGTKAKVGGMGGNQVITDEAQLADMKKQTILFEQLSYMEDGSTLTLKGVDDVDGEKAYKVEVADADGNKKYDFYSIKSGLLLKEVESQEGPDGSSMDVTTSYGDYKAVEGIMFPHTMTVTGAMPFPLVMTVDKLEVNMPISPDKFSVE